MDDIVKNVYFREIVRQADAAAMNAQSFNEALADRTASDQLPRIYLSAQGILTAGALISKILWLSEGQRRPSGCKCPRDPKEEQKHADTVQRCDDLRDALGISGPMPDLRSVRNALEHFDDEFDKFIASGDSIIVDMNIAPKGAISIGGSPPRYLRNIDPTTLEITVFGRSAHLNQVMSEITDIRDRAQRWLNEHDPANQG